MDLLKGFLQVSWQSFVSLGQPPGRPGLHKEWKKISHSDAAGAPHPPRTKRPKEPNMPSNQHPSEHGSGRSSVTVPRPQDDEMIQLYPTLLDAYKIMSRRQSELMLQESQATTDISSCQHKHRHVDESISLMISRLLARDGNNTGSAIEAESLRDQLASDGEAFRNQTQTMMNALSGMKQKRWDAAEATTHFTKALAEFIAVLPNGQNLWKAMQEAADRDEGCPSEMSDDIPEEAHEYFEAVGQMQILREQLLELRQEHSDERVQRNHFLDQEKPVSETDSEFEAKLTEGVSELNTLIQKASWRVMSALQICEDKKIDVEALRKRNRQEDSDETGNGASNTSPRPSSPAFGSDIFRRSAEIDQDRSETLVGTEKSIDNHGRPSTDKVDRWLGGCYI